MVVVRQLSVHIAGDIPTGFLKIKYIALNIYSKMHPFKMSISIKMHRILLSSLKVAHAPLQTIPPLMPQAYTDLTSITID